MGRPYALMEMQTNLFVFGTLKRGFPLHDPGLRGAQFVGLYRTQERFPLAIAGPWFAPMMFDEPGNGHKVRGELYRVHPCQLVALDQMESIGKPGNLRLKIAVEPVAQGNPVQAFVYMKTRDVAGGVYHSGLLESYEDNRFIVPAAR